MNTLSFIANELRLERKFCDAVLKVENVEFQVHKVVMCACDPFFTTLFLSSSDTEDKYFTIEGLSHETMSQIIDFAYTGSVTMTDVFQLMITANQLNMSRLEETCYKILKDQLCPENCIGLWHFTNTNHFLKLQHKAFHFICDHFEDVALCDGFLQLELQELADILGRDDLNVSQESKVYESVLRWINHRTEEREGTIAILLSKVRLGFMDKDYIRHNVSNNNLVKTNRESRLMVLQVTESQSKINDPFIRPRLPNAVLLAIGGEIKNAPYDVVEAYNYWTNSWITVPMGNLGPALRYHSTVFLCGFIYAVGGRENKKREFSNRVHRFNADKHVWQEVLPMHQNRGSLSVTVLNKCIYAMGGLDKHVILNTAEYYQPNIDQWTLITSMNHRRIDASCSTLNNKIYICGGYNGYDQLNSAECYNPDTDQWTLITPMGKHRMGLGVIAYVDHIFAVGGFNGSLPLSSAEAYNPVTNTWHNVSDMIERHCRFGIAVINERIFVVDDSPQVECYNSTTDSWSFVCCRTLYRSDLRCCVISGLSNMAEYCVPRNPVLH